jgi:hypothetical protein
MEKLIWKRTGRTVSKDGTTTIYHAAGTSFTIESRKRHIPHANRSGTWDHTSYWVLNNCEQLVEKQSLRDAKEYAEKLMEEEV